MLTLRLHTPPGLPLELEHVNPAALSGLSLTEVAKQPIAYGNRTVELGEFFHVSGSNVDRIEFEGDLAKVNRLGERMTTGTISVRGNVGRHLGAYLFGGTIIVEGLAGDWAGAEMSTGSITIRGNAGSQLGAAYRGSRIGMKGGTIAVYGNARDEVGLRMRRGFISVAGSLGDHAGAAMIAGTLIAGSAGTACGAGMKRGTIVLGNKPKDMSPGHRFSCRTRPAYLGVLHRELERIGAIPKMDFENDFACWRGDILHGGHGELLIAAND